MQATQFYVRQRQDCLIVINDCALRHSEVCLIGISTKRDWARPNRGKLFDGVYHCHVRFGLIFKNAQFGRAIVRDGAISVQMVGGEVEPDADRGTKAADCFQLERTYFHREHVERLFFAHHF